MWRGCSKPFTSQHRAPKALSRCSSYYYSWLSVGGGVRWGYLAFQAIILSLCRTLECQGPIFLPGVSGHTSPSQLLLDLPLHLHLALIWGDACGGMCVACEHSREGSGWLQRCLLSCEGGQVECREGCPRKGLPRPGSDPRAEIFPASTREGNWDIHTVKCRLCQADLFSAFIYLHTAGNQRSVLFLGPNPLLPHSATLCRDPRFQLVQHHLLIDKEREAQRRGMTCPRSHSKSVVGLLSPDDAAEGSQMRIS